MHPGMKAIFEDVAQYGWHVVAVYAEGDAPEFAFSIGLFETYGHPELVIFGLEMHKAHGVIASCRERIQEGAALEAGQVRTDVLIGYSVAVLPVEQCFYSDYLGSAIGFYDGFDFPALQLVWPDKNNRFPWEPEFDESLAHLQVLLNTAGQ